MNKKEKTTDQFPEISINEITGRYDAKHKVYHFFIDKIFLPDPGYCDEIGFFDHAKKIIHFSCQGPGLSVEQVRTVIKFCEKIEDIFSQ